MACSNKNMGLYEPRREHDGCGIGAVVNINGRRDHSIIEYGKEILVNLHHRGAAGADEVTGDGAGILFQIPHDFFSAECSNLGFSLPLASKYGVGMVFGSQNEELNKKCNKVLEDSVKHYGMKVLGWRNVPTSNDCLGKIALVSEPTIRQIFVDGAGSENELLEQKLYLSRKRAEKLVRKQFGQEGNDFYVSSLSCRTICYKGMFMAWQLFAYYPDLADERLISALAIVHQRYSTNTFPSWQLAQPLRCVAHNGEINTLSGNRNWMQARQMKMSCQTFGDHISDVFPILTPEASDSACFDNVLELLVRAGRSMPHSIMMMIPEAFGSSYHISTDKRAFYEYHSSIMEPWDGPAAMVFTDGRIVGGTLDRNGLRPCRWLVTTEGLVVMASEVGVVQFPPEKIRQKGRLQPGHMFLVDTSEGRIISDNEIKSKVARQRPYRRWLDQNKIELRGLFDVPKLLHTDLNTLARRLRLFGYTREELKMILLPMALNAQEPVGSMGNDTPLAVLSDRPKLLFNYFKQLFAQVTNPAIDPLREGRVMSLMNFVGKKPNILTETPEHCRQLKLPHPILTNEDVNRLHTAKRQDLKVVTISSVFDINVTDVAASLRQAISELVDSAQQAIEKGASLIIISDRQVSETKAPIPSLLAVAAIHHGLLSRGLRGEVGLIVESGEPREVMHFCLLCGFGANAINPYLAFETLDYLQQDGRLPVDMESSQIADNFRQ